MKYLLPLLLLFVSCTPAPSLAPAPPPAPAPPYDAAIRDGTVIFWMGGPLVKPILRNTESDITHAAIILYQQGEPWVYEAVPPRVHKVPLDSYRIMMAEKAERRHPTTWFTLQPRFNFAPSELDHMKSYAESQLGRHYALRGWWEQREVRGIFCSELIADIIAQSGLIESGGVHESPGSLHDKLLPTYRARPTP